MRSGDSRILFHHRIAEGVDDPFKLCVSPDRFAAHLDEIARYGEPSTLAELSLPSLRPRIVVTFDDGCADNLIDAVPIAEEKGVPTTIFAPQGEELESTWLQGRPGALATGSRWLISGPPCNG